MGFILVNRQKNRVFGIVLVALVVSPGLLAGVADGAGNSVETQLLDYMNAAVDVWGFQGAVLVAKGDDILLQDGYGFANKESKSPITPSTKFLIGSITKSFTAIAIMQLRDRGLLDLSDPANRYVDEVPEAIGDKITIRQLLNHTSGLPDYVNLPGFQERAERSITPSGIVRLFADLPLRFEPGSRFEYSSSGYILLGLIIESVSGQAYETYIRENIIEPAGLNNTGIFNDYSRREDFAVGYERSNGNRPTRSRVIHPSAGYAAGCLSSSAGDLYLLDRALYGEDLLRRQTIKEMLTQQARNYGYGWFVKDFDGHMLTGHAGATPGYSGVFQRWISDNVCVVVLCNQFTPSDFTIALHLAAIVLEEPYSSPVSRNPGVVAGSLVSSVTGKYRTGNGGIWTVLPGENRLFLNGPNDDQDLFLYESGLTFYSDRDHSSTLTFQKDGNGQISGLIIRRPLVETIAAKLRRSEEDSLSGVHGSLTVPAATLRKYAGKYQMSPVDFVLTISMGNDVLFAQALGNPPIEMVPIDTTSFALRGLTAKITFHIDPDGSVNRLRFTQENLEGSGERILGGFPRLSGPYLGQKPPGLTPERFAPGVLPVDGVEHCFPAFAPGGRELFWMRVDSSGESPRGEIWTMREVDGQWQPPKLAAFSGKNNDHAPVFSGDGRRLYFASDRAGGFEKCKGIWYVERTELGWSEPAFLGSPSNSEVCATQPTFTKDGTVYFAGRYAEGQWGTGIFRSRFVNGVYEAPELLGPEINTTHADAYPFIDFDERYLLFASSRPGTASSETDLYIALRDAEGVFHEPNRLDSAINNGLTVSFSCVSPDGKYLFFTRFDNDGDNGTDMFYWVDAKILNPYLPPPEVEE